MAKHRFCTDLCHERGEPLAGTGDAPQRALMLAWPRGKWRTPRWESIGMSEELSDAIHHASHSGLHVALVDKVEAADTLPTLTALPEGISADFDKEADLVSAILGYTDGTLFEGRRDDRTVVICCTDSRRDACCAKHGFSTYKALVEQADQSRFHIVQATHIGGCRFAASLIVFPQRQRYGRMSAAQAPDFLAALAKNEVYLPAYKGRSDSPEPLQVAEIAVLNWMKRNKLGNGSVRFKGNIPEEAGEGTKLVLNAEIGETRLSVHMHAQTFLVQGNCGVVAKGGGENQLRWCLDAVKPSPA